MPKPEKMEMVAWLKEKLGQSSLAVFADYRGLPAPELSRLRQKLKGQGMEFRIVKNTLGRLAVKGRAEGGRLFDGPTAVAFAQGEEAALARSLLEAARNLSIPLRIKGAILGARVLSPEGVSYLASLPPRETLLAQALAGMKSPLYSLGLALSAPMRGLLAVLKGRIQQLEGGKDG